MFNKLFLQAASPSYKLLQIYFKLEEKNYKTLSDILCAVMSQHVSIDTLDWNFSLAEKLANQSLQDRATMRQYFPNKPSTHPPIHPTGWIIEVEYLRNQLMDDSSSKISSGNVCMEMQLDSPSKVVLQ